MDSIPDPSSSKPGRHPPSPWSYVVRGDPDGSPSSPPPPPPPPPPPTAAAVVVAAPIPPPPEAAADAVSPLDSVSDGADKGSSAAAAAAASPVKKAAWKRPADGSIEVGPVMGAELWPALSESTKAASKPSPSASSSSSSSDFLKSSDGSASASPGPMIVASSPKVNSNNPNPNSNPNHAAPQREKSMRRSTLANGGPSQPLIVNPDKQPSLDPSPKDQPNINRNNWEHGTRSGDHGRGYGGTHRRGNNGSGSSSGGGGGSHHGGYNGRRDHGRGAGGGFDGYYRNANVRDVHVAQQPRSIRPPPPPPFVRAPLHVAPPPPFISPPSLARPFGHPMAFPEMHSPVYYVPGPPPPEAIGGLPFVAHPAATPTFIFPPMDPQKAKLLTQINYYFSSENLCKDIFLRQNMDEQGWVPLSLIANFNRVREITNSLEFIIETVQLSTVAELQGDKIRRRNDWMNWVLPHPNNIIPASGPSSPATPNVDTLSAHFQTVGLDAMNIRSSMRGPTRANSILNRSASGNNLNTRPQMGDIHGNRISHAFTGHTDSSEQNSARSLARSDTL